MNYIVNRGIQNKAYTTRIHVNSNDRLLSMQSQSRITGISKAGAVNQC